MRALDILLILWGAISIFPGAFCLGMDYAESEFYNKRKHLSLKLASAHSEAHQDSGAAQEGE